MNYQNWSDMEKPVHPEPEPASPDAKSLQKLLETAPEVILDFIYDEGLFFISVQNISDRPAFKVKVVFEPPFKGLGGSLEVTSMPLFRNIEFLAPHKDIRTFIDTSTAYFGRGEPTQITARITFRDGKNQRYSSTIHHDLEIYRTIVTVRRRTPQAPSPAGDERLSD
jgi:hypothetical protein